MPYSVAACLNIEIERKTENLSYSVGGGGQGSVTRRTADPPHLRPPCDGGGRIARCSISQQAVLL